LAAAWIAILAMEFQLSYRAFHTIGPLRVHQLRLVNVFDQRGLRLVDPEADLAPRVVKMVFPAVAPSLKSDRTGRMWII
jgi:hypothetical protein